MSYIAREDGEHFVVPSYRDVITAKSPGIIKKEMSTLSGNYGDYATLQRKGPLQYEVAFSTDIGYLLGETVWYYFKRPLDMIYCEAVPNTTEAILVIVKDGSVYLDGRFSVESIPEELVIFLTQQNHFNIFVYGDVPISETPDEGKFSFEPSSVQSFKVLETPVFDALPLLKIYQLQPVEQVLKEHGIGVFPVKKAVIGSIIVGLLWLMWTYMTAEKETVRQIIIKQSTPYQAYNDALTSPAPDVEISHFVEELKVFFGLPGWSIKQIDYSRGSIRVAVISSGSNIQTLEDWGKRNGINLDMNPKGIVLTKRYLLTNRPIPTEIYPLKQVVINFADNIAAIYPGNRIKFSKFNNLNVFSRTTIAIALSGVSPALLGLIGEQCKGLPLVLNSITLKSGSEQFFSGAITFDALGS